jgi:site-specific recombinase XerD
MLFFDTIEGTNPFRHLTMIEIVEPAPRALSETEWNAVRRSAEAAARRDHGLSALATLFRYAGPRVSEVAALQIPDVQVGAQPGDHCETWSGRQTLFTSRPPRSAPYVCQSTP